MIAVDFHNHSTYSDGLLTPCEMVERAFNNDVKYFSITDHDTINGLKEASEAANKFNITFIPGIELSTTHNNESIHILGFFKDTNFRNPELLTYLNSIQKRRIERAKKMVEKLKSEFNIDISFEKVLNRGKEVVARPHIAYEIMSSGYPYDMEYIFNNFIGKNCAAYVPSTKLSTEEGINLIKNNGGLAILAHPVLIKNSSLEEFLNLGIDGLEAIYFQNTLNDEEKIIRFAQKNNLLITAGSDCHGNFKTDKRHGDIGCMKYKEEYLMKFLNALNKVPSN